jgi:hypothetical protein
MYFFSASTGFLLQNQDQLVEAVSLGDGTVVPVLFIVNLSGGLVVPGVTRAPAAQVTLIDIPLTIEVLSMSATAVYGPQLQDNVLQATIFIMETPLPDPAGRLVATNAMVMVPLPATLSLTTTVRAIATGAPMLVIPGGSQIAIVVTAASTSVVQVARLAVTLTARTLSTTPV